VRFLDLCFVKNPVESAAKPHAHFDRSDRVSVRNIDNSDAIALRHYTPKRAMCFTRSAMPRRCESDRGGAAFGVAPEALFRDLRWTTPSLVTARGQALHSSMRFARAHQLEALPGLVREREWESGVHSAGRGCRPRFASAALAPPLDRSGALPAQRRHRSHPDEARLCLQMHLLHLPKRRRLGIPHPRPQLVATRSKS